MKTKVKPLLLGLVCVALGASVAIWFCGRRDSIDKNGFDQIQPGMTLSEAEGVLGQPPGDYRLSKDARKRYSLDHWGTRTHNYKFWDSGRGGMFVYFSEDETVIGGTFFPPIEDSISETWRRAVSTMLQ